MCYFFSWRNILFLLYSQFVVCACSENIVQIFVSPKIAMCVEFVPLSPQMCSDSSRNCSSYAIFLFQVDQYFIPFILIFCYVCSKSIFNFFRLTCGCYVIYSSGTKISFHLVYYLCPTNSHDMFFMFLNFVKCGLTILFVLYSWLCSVCSKIIIQILFLIVWNYCSTYTCNLLCQLKFSFTLSKLLFHET